MAFKVLLVDDEPNVLSALRRNLADYLPLSCASSGKHALSLFAEEGPFSVVVTDMRMPDMDGLTLLRELRRRSPETVCLVLSGQTDFETLVAALNEGELFRFHTKPVTPEVLRASVEHAQLEHHRRTRNPRLPPSGSRLLDDALALRSGIAAGHLCLHLQPQLCLADGAITGAEALLRWNHPSRGLLYPGQFFDAIETGGLMPDITPWVLDAAGKQIRDWQGTEMKSLHLAVNVTVTDLLDPGFVGLLESCIARYGLVGDCLELELTEEAAVTNVTATRAVMEAVARLGVRWAIDDFGTGYSTFGWLKQLPVDKLKIDRLFIEDIARDAHALRLVKNIISMAHDLGCRVVAEGPETEDQLRLLAECQCDLVQGYAVARPMPPEEIPAWLGRFADN